MKKLLLLIGCCISINTWAVDCSNIPHAKIPAKNLSLYNSKTGHLDDFSVVRNKLIQNGWQPISEEETAPAAQYPEMVCLPDRCIYSYGDQYGNTLMIEQVDDISNIMVICKSVSS